MYVLRKNGYNEVYQNVLSRWENYDFFSYFSNFALFPQWIHFLWVRKKAKINIFLKIHNHNIPKLLNKIYITYFRLFLFPKKNKQNHLQVILKWPPRTLELLTKNKNKKRSRSLLSISLTYTTIQQSLMSCYN